MARGSRPEVPKGALAGVRVLDFSRFLSGPVCTMLLADMGADVIKVEHPRGDDARHLPPPPARSAGGTFYFANRNKRSVVLDLNNERQRAAAQALAAEVDVVVQNFMPGVMSRHQLAYEDLATRNPRLVYCSINAFGTSGELASRPGYDPIVQAESGFLSLNGNPDGPPFKCGAPVMDVSSALMASNAVLGALFARQATGKGQHVEVCLYDTAVFMNGHLAMNSLLSGDDIKRTGNGSPMIEPMSIFEAADGPFYLSCATDRDFRKLAEGVLEAGHLADDARFARNRDRLKNREALYSELGRHFQKLPREELLARALRVGVALGLVRTVREALHSPEMKQRGLVTEVRTSDGIGTLPNLAPPFRFSGTPIRDPIGAPVLGQHTSEVLSELLGWDDQQIAGVLAGENDGS